MLGYSFTPGSGGVDSIKFSGFRSRWHTPNPVAVLDGAQHVCHHGRDVAFVLELVRGRVHDCVKKFAPGAAFHGEVKVRVVFQAFVQLNDVRVPRYLINSSISLFRVAIVLRFRQRFRSTFSAAG